MTSQRVFVLPFIIGTCLMAEMAVAELWDGILQGKHDVGFETRNLIDETRPAGADWDTSESRPIQLSIWYPAAPSETDAVAFAVRDYVALTATEFSSAPDSVGEDVRANALESITDFPLHELPESDVTTALDLQARARLGALPASGHFPLLVIIPGNHDPAWRHFLLAEYLASHGYVVAAFPSAVRRTRDAFAMSMSLTAFRDQVHDTAFAVDYMSAQHSSVDPAKIMLFGFSMGGNTGGFNLLRSRQIDGFACLDCGIGSTWGTGALNDQFDQTFPAAANRPIAFLHISEGGERNDDSFIDRFKLAHAYHSVVTGARHFDFTSLGAIAGEIAGLQHEQWLSPGDVSRAVHGQSIEAVRWFLDAHLKNDKSAVTALKSTSPRDRVHIHRIVEPSER